MHVLLCLAVIVAGCLCVVQGYYEDHWESARIAAREENWARMEAKWYGGSSSSSSSSSSTKKTPSPTKTTATKKAAPAPTPPKKPKTIKNDEAIKAKKATDDTIVPIPPKNEKKDTKLKTSDKVEKSSKKDAAAKPASITNKAGMELFPDENKDLPKKSKSRIISAIYLADGDGANGKNLPMQMVAWGRKEDDHYSVLIHIDMGKDGETPSAEGLAVDVAVNGKSLDKEDELVKKLKDSMPTMIAQMRKFGDVLKTLEPYTFVTSTTSKPDNISAKLAKKVSEEGFNLDLPSCDDVALFEGAAVLKDQRLLVLATNKCEGKFIAILALAKEQDGVFAVDQADVSVAENGLVVKNRADLSSNKIRETSDHEAIATALNNLIPLV